jgi:hypothetical protein
MPRPSKQMKRTQFRPRTPSLASPVANQGKCSGQPGSDLRVNDNARPGQNRPKSRRDTIPPKVRRAVNQRDEWCQMCGSPSLLEQHHRRLKQAGGDPRPHTDCPCNLVRLCRRHHRWAHRHRIEAEAIGVRVPAETAEPGRVSVMRGTEDGGGATMWPTCDGQWAAESPWTEAAA